jgi:SAM-dependent methyltransferase
MPCPCCEANDWQGRWPGFLVCRRCGLMTVEHEAEAEQLKQHYQEAYFQGREYIDYLADKSAIQKTLARHLRLVQRHVPAGGRILEIGCAYGFFLELISKIYPGSVGVDVAAAGVAWARARGLDAREGDVLTLDLAGPFDALCLWDTIEHLPRPYETLRRACGWLQPGAHLFLSTGDLGALLPRLQGRRWRQIHPPTHLFYFTRLALRELFRRLGVEVVSFRTVRVHRRLRSALQAMARFHPEAFSGRLAGRLLRVLPGRLLNWDVPLNLGDTLVLAGRKHDGPTQRS